MQLVRYFNHLVPAFSFRSTPGFWLAVVSFGLTLLWVWAIPPLQAPDEPAHLQAIMQVRRAHILPEVHYDFSRDPLGVVVHTPGDAATQAYTIQHGLGNDPFKLLSYESMQPPLYYAIVGIVGLTLPADPATLLYLGRIIAAVFGAGVVYFCWAATRQLAPGAPLWAVAAAGCVALLPQFDFNSATAANDSLLNCVCTAAFYVWVRGLRDPTYDPHLLRASALVGLALLAKLTAVALLPGLGLLVVLHAWQAAPSWGGRAWSALRLSLGCGGVLLAVCGWWFARNLVVYGEISGSRDALLFYQHHFLPLDLNVARQVELFIVGAWQSAWGLFGWMSRPLPVAFYTQAAYLTLFLLGLTILSLLKAVVTRRQLPLFARQAILVLFSVGGSLIFGYMQFSQTIAMQPQSRYLFPLLCPLILLLTRGLYSLSPGGRVRVLVLSIPLLYLAVMNAVALAVVSDTEVPLLLR